MNHNNKVPTVMMMMLCMRCTLGGGEKRYGRVFQMLIDQTARPHKLLITRELLDLLHKAGILVGYDEHLIILDPPFRKSQYLSRNFLGRLLRPLLVVLDILWYIWQIHRAVQRYKPDVVHPHLNAIYFSLPVLVLNPKVRHVMSANAEKFRPSKGHNPLGAEIAAWLKHYAMHRCDLIDALSEARKAAVVERGISPNKILVNPGSFTDYSLCQPATQKENWVVFLARLIEEKGPHLLVQAIPQVLAKEPDVHFYILGEGYFEPEVVKAIQDLGIVDNVTLRFETCPTKILNQSQIFTSLNLLNSYPNQALLEAMGCGNAVVATDIGENYLLVDEKVGVRVPPEPDAIAKAIVDLLCSPNLSKMQKAARQRAITEHTPERFFEYITTVYRRATQGTPSPPPSPASSSAARGKAP